MFLTTCLRQKFPIQMMSRTKYKVSLKIGYKSYELVKEIIKELIDI
jgi:hypothetical protein